MQFLWLPDFFFKNHQKLMIWLNNLNFDLIIFQNNFLLNCLFFQTWSKWSTFKESWSPIRSKLLNFSLTSPSTTSVGTPSNFRICAQLNALDKRFKICYILCVQNPKVAFSVFHFMQHYYFFLMMNGLCWQLIHKIWQILSIFLGH